MPMNKNYITSSLNKIEKYIVFIYICAIPSHQNKIIHKNIQKIFKMILYK